MSTLDYILIYLLGMWTVMFIEIIIILIKIRRMKNSSKKSNLWYLR